MTIFTVRNHIVAALTVAGSLFFGGSAQSAGENPGDTQQCIRMADVDHTSVIDGKTILVTMKRDAYKRIDLVTRCLGLAVEEGFSFSMQTYELCKSTPLRVINYGGVCAIDKIVNIDQAEARSLLARK